MVYSTILFEIRDDGIAILTVNRPEKLNALNRATMEEINDVITKIHEKRDGGEHVRALIITGAGEKAFIAGADIQELNKLSPVEAYWYTRWGQSVLDKIEGSPVPVIAAINGYALGGGCELAMACHIRMAVPEAKFGQPEVKLGLIPGYGGTQRLARLIGAGRAIEWVTTGQFYSAEEAYRVGLVNRIVPKDELIPEAIKLAQTICGNGPVAVSLAIRAVVEGVRLPLGEALKYEASLFSLTAATEDMKEGTSAFLEKRTPQFKGK